MADPCKRHQVAISYHTETDSELANALISGLARIDVTGMFLPYLNVKGYTIEALRAASEQRVDGWINQYMNMLEGCRGMIVIATPHSLESEHTEGRGMWTEVRLAQYQAPSSPEFIYRLVHPSLQLLSAPHAQPLQGMLDELGDLGIHSGGG